MAKRSWSPNLLLLKLDQSQTLFFNPRCQKKREEAQSNAICHLTPSWSSYQKLWFFETFFFNPISNWSHQKSLTRWPKSSGRIMCGILDKVKVKEIKQTQNMGSSIDIFRIKDMLKYNIYNTTYEVSGFGIGLLYSVYLLVILASQLNLHFHHLNQARRWTWTKYKISHQNWPLQHVDLFVRKSMSHEIFKMVFSPRKTIHNVENSLWFMFS